MRRHGQICRPILIVGTDADAIALLHAAQRSPHLGYRVVGFVGPDDIGQRGGVRVLGGDRRDPAGAGGDRRDRRADLPVVGRVRGGQPVDPRADRRRLPRGPFVRPARHRRRSLPCPGPRRAHADLRRADPARWLACRRQADVRHRGLAGCADADGAAPADRRHRHQAQLPRTGDLRPGACGARRPDVPGLQAADDGCRRRCDASTRWRIATRRTARCSRSPTTLG